MLHDDAGHVLCQCPLSVVLLQTQEGFELMFGFLYKSFQIDYTWHRELTTRH